jgi:hypothetical protein
MNSQDKIQFLIKCLIEIYSEHLEMLDFIQLPGAEGITELSIIKDRTEHTLNSLKEMDSRTTDAIDLSDLFNR